MFISLIIGVIKLLPFYYDFKLWDEHIHLVPSVDRSFTCVL